MQHEIKLKAKNRLKTYSLKKTMAFYDMINKITIYLTRMVIITNNSHAEKKKKIQFR